VLILGLLVVRSHPCRRGGRGWKGWRSSWYSSHGGSAISVELELIGEDSPYILKLVKYMVVGGFSLWSTCVGVQDGLSAAWTDLVVVVEPKKL